MTVESPTLAVFETSRSVDIWVVRSGDAATSATVSFATEDGSAQSGSDYTSTSGQAADLYTDLALFQVRNPLEPSTQGNDVRRYIAFSQGIDKVGNVQTTMDEGQNKNDFEVKPS